MTKEYQDLPSDGMVGWDDPKSELEHLRKEVEVLKAALKPFADAVAFVEQFSNFMRTQFWCSLTVAPSLTKSDFQLADWLLNKTPSSAPTCSCCTLSGTPVYGARCEICDEYETLDAIDTPDCHKSAKDRLALLIRYNRGQPSDWCAARISRLTALIEAYESKRHQLELTEHQH